MDRDAVLARIADIGIVPVVRADRAEDACAVVDALCDGGIPVVEITMTVPGALDVMRQVSRKYGSKVLLGAGTVLDVEQARQCISAGAAFLVSPGLSTAVLRYAQNERILAVPGVFSPTEVMAALAEGSQVMKVFPCGSVGGPSYIKSLHGPFPGVSFIPTGGVSLNNVGHYIAAGAVAVGIGGELVSVAALRAGNLDSIQQAARALLEAVQTARRTH
jgi:2-dehydro-3-deoxyphosphogluconate aldolase/(4S)-4-hydroxy-2-oxoglutarate aldolase